MSTRISLADGHGPEWAAAVADLTERAQAAFARAGVRGCLTVLDLQPWRQLDAWWLRRRLEPLARLSGRPIRYVPCLGPASAPPGNRIAAVAAPWSAGAAPVQLCWPVGADEWTPDGAVLVLAGDLPQRLTQDLLLAHHGRIHEWLGAPGEKQWQPLEPARYSGWVADSVAAYVEGLPSCMLSLPAGYWRFLQQAMAWASRGCIVLARAPGWSSLAQIREHAAQRAEVHADTPPVNFHWLAQHAPRIGASAHTVHASREDSVQLMVRGLPDAQALAPTLCARLSGAMRSDRGHRARAVSALAACGEMEAALSVLEHSAQDPALLRTAWDKLARKAASVEATVASRLGAWLERVMTDNPWLGDDLELLRASGHLALACGRLDLAQSALRALDETGHAVAADLAALARCDEQLGRFDAARTACARALSRDPLQQDALQTRDRVAQRAASLSAPWRVQHGADDMPLLLDPLHAGHAPALLRQMRDSSIPSMTALPPLVQGDDGRAWIQARLDEGVAAYAIVHRRFGFAGYLDLRVWQSTAFVCYWIGPDYQGLGLCAPAVALACELARRNGIELLLSSAYDDNVRSLRALRRSGFARMDVRAQAPDADRAFLMRPIAAMDADEARKRLAEFCENTNSGLRFTDLTTSRRRDECQ